MHPIVRANIAQRQKTNAQKAAAMHSAGKNTRKRSKVAGSSKRAGSSAYRPAGGLCYDGSWLAAALEI